MAVIKRLDRYILQRFLPLLLMTFFICLFIVMMQFLWRTVDELVGKGIEVSVIAELFFYAALTFVPTALPLAVLLASLMVFGNLGEKFELTAMKASGISLFRIMRPLIVFMGFLAVVAFFFMNDVQPVAQTKMWTLFFSVRQKSPEVEIPERAFYDQIPNMNLYVDHKDRETGMLYGMMIYDMAKGLDNSRVILADSGRFNFTEDKTHLFLHLYSGEMFENMRDNTMGMNNSQRYLPFRREHFTEKKVYFPFDANFNRIDEEGMRSQYIGQDIKQLRHSIDSIGRQVDSIGDIYASELLNATYFGLRPTENVVVNGQLQTIPRRSVALDKPIDVDSVFQAPNASYAKSYVSQALAKAKRQKQEYLYRSMVLSDQARLMRRHDIEMQRKFTLSFAVIIFFFIGAPLGAIIKKGGIGTPLVISVLLFIVYFIFDNAGFKMARDGKIEVWEGIWLSSMVMLPLGIFFTYKAVGDSAVFNIDAWRNALARLTGRVAGRSLSLKEVRMADVDNDEALEMLDEFLDDAIAEQDRIAHMGRIKKLIAKGPAQKLKVPMNHLVDYLSNSPDIYVINLLNSYPFNPTTRNINVVVATTQALMERIGGKDGANIK